MHDAKPPASDSDGLARTELVSVIKMGLRGTTRKFQGLLTLVANHRGVTAGLSSATFWGNHTRADR